MQLASFNETALRRNIAWVQLLGLCPLLAVSENFIHALALSTASAVVLICSAVIVSLLRTFISDALRLPALVVVISTFTTLITMLIESLSWSLYAAIALYFQIIVTNCMILGRLQSVAIRSRLAEAFTDA
ncbi:MAG: electron transport complex subunit RsxE, partial [Gammaproteobacteria bacterium]|nr:electron transport complex subunit RsxE [Gammaproteobacteria bacterium]